MDKQPPNSPDLDLDLLRQELLTAGWDALTGVDQIVARLENPPGRGIWTLALDRSGRFRFAVTRKTIAPEGNIAERRGHLYRVLREDQRILTIIGRLDPAESLSQLVNDLRDILTERRDETSGAHR